jgi:hypothetical protein
MTFSEMALALRVCRQPVSAYRGNTMLVRPHHNEREKHDEARKDQAKLESSDACFHSGDP